MPNPATIFLKAILWFAVSVALFRFAQQVGTVEVTLFADGAMTNVPVGADESVYRPEVDLARKKALWVYAISGFAALIGILSVRKGVRVYRRMGKA